ncbi:retrovirus-related pol polyprotein from transposon TNT 1-94 [Tanacetum coccineum]
MTLELSNRQLCRPDEICKDVLVPVGKFTYPADFVVVDYVPDEQIPLILGRPFLRTARALIDVYDEKLILRDGNESLTLNMQSEKSNSMVFKKLESFTDDIFNVPNYIGFKDLFAQMYSGSPTIQSDNSFPSSSPMKTSDSTFGEFTDEFTLPNSSPPGDDVSILKKDLQEDTFQIISNPLFEFDDNFKSSNVNPLFEESDKDVEIKSSFSSTLTSPEESELEAYLEKDSIPPGIDLNLSPILKVSSSNPTSPTLTGEKDSPNKFLQPLVSTDCHKSQETVKSSNTDTENQKSTKPKPKEAKPSPKPKMLCRECWRSKEELQSSASASAILDLNRALLTQHITKIALSISKLKAAHYLDFGLEELVPSLWVESEREYDISAVYGITHWWFRRKEFYINKHSESSDREAVRSQMRILSVISVKVFEKYGYNYLREIILRRADYQEYKISEKDFRNLHPNDFEDLFLLNIQEKLNHLHTVKTRPVFTKLFNMW